MNISISLPDEIAAEIGEHWTDVPRRALEALVAEAYREKVITGQQAREMLGLSRHQLDAFLKRAGIYLDYSVEDLKADRRTLREVLST